MRCESKGPAEGKDSSRATQLCGQIFRKQLTGHQQEPEGLQMVAVPRPGAPATDGASSPLTPQRNLSLIRPFSFQQPPLQCAM